MSVRVCGGTVDTMNFGHRPQRAPYLYCAAREGPTATKSAGAPIRMHEEIRSITGSKSLDL
jgi:hypothetical protein